MLLGCTLLVSIDDDLTAGSPVVDAGLPPAVDAFVGADADAAPAEPPGLLAYWSFDEGAGDVAQDPVGDHDGLLAGAPAWTTGRRGSALRADGADDRMRVPTLDGAAFPPSGTLSLWVQPSSIEGEWILDVYDFRRSHIFVRTRTSDGDRPDRLEVVFQQAADAEGTPAAFGAYVPVAVGEWRHVVVVWDTAEHRGAYYVDGRLAASEALPPAWTPAGQRFSLFDVGCCGGFVGAVDEVRLYGRALAAGEVAALP